MSGRSVIGLEADRLRGAREWPSWRPGHHYRPGGRASEDKIKFLFQEARIPLWERRNWPILAIEDNIVWARRFGPAVPYAATSASRSVVKVTEMYCLADI